MALIDYLDKPDWEESLRSTFEYSLELLKTDRFRYAGSAVDDLKTWLAVGGISRVKHHLNNQMKQCRYPEDKRLAVNDFLDQLVQEHRRAVVDLITRDIIRADSQEFIFILGFTRIDIEDLLSQYAAGKSFEDVARTQGYSEEDIEWAKSIADRWFDKNLNPGMIGDIN